MCASVNLLHRRSHRVIYSMPYADFVSDDEYAPERWRGFERIGQETRELVGG